MTAVLHVPYSVEQLDGIASAEESPDAPIPFVPIARLAPIAEDISDADASITDIEDAADAYALAAALEQQLEDERPLVKALGALNVHHTQGMALTSAEKVAALDADYKAHQARQRDAIVDRIRKMGAYEAAKRSADLQIALVTARMDGRDPPHTE